MKKFIGIMLFAAIFAVAAHSPALAVSKEERIRNLKLMAEQMERGIKSNDIELEFLNSQLTERTKAELKENITELRKIREERVELLRRVKEAIKKEESQPE